MNYKLNNIEVSVEEIRKLIKENPEIVGDLEKKSKFFKPKEGEIYWMFESSDVFENKNDGTTINKDSIQSGVYRTEAEAEKALEKQKALVRLWNYADEKMFYRPDWNNEDESKWSVYFDYKGKMWQVDDYYSCRENFIFPHFKNYKDAEQFINDNLSDLNLFLEE